MKYKVMVCREVWGAVEVEADTEHEAIKKVEDWDYESDFVPTGKLGNQSVYKAEKVGEMHE